MPTGNYIRNAYIEGRGWQVHVEISAQDDEALAKAKACVTDLVAEHPQYGYGAYWTTPPESLPE